MNPPDALEGGTRTGLDGWMVAEQNLRTGVGPSATYEIEELVERGDRVFLRGFLRPRGTISGAEVEGRKTYPATPYGVIRSRSRADGGSLLMTAEGGEIGSSRSICQVKR